MFYGLKIEKSAALLNRLLILF